MRTYKVSDALCPYVVKNLSKYFLSCFLKKNEEGNWLCETNASSDMFHQIVMIAKAELESVGKELKCVLPRMVNRAYLYDGLKAYTVSYLPDEYL